MPFQLLQFHLQIFEPFTLSTAGFFDRFQIQPLQIRLI